MKFATAEKAPAPRWRIAVVVAWTYAAVLVVMVLSQLFAFEDFIPLMDTDHKVAVIASCLIVFAEVFALPFLLRMPLSPLMRWMSLVCSVLVPTVWLKLAIAAQINDVTTNSGMLGVVLDVPTGTPSLIFALILVMLAAGSVWGLWPRNRK